MKRLLRLLAVAGALLSAGRGAGAATFVLLESDPNDPIGGGATERIEPPARPVFSADVVRVGNTPRVTVVGVRVDPGLGAGQGTWLIALGAPDGEYVTPGTSYEFAVDPATGRSSDFSGPEVLVERNGRTLSKYDCSSMAGRFTIRELSQDPIYLRSLVADLEAHCDGRTAGFKAALRYDSGDPTCDGQPDGTACSDSDGCTSGDYCSAGHCASGAPLVCDDGNVRTDDRCSVWVEGCQHVPAASVWTVTGSARVTAVGPRGSISREAAMVFSRSRGITANFEVRGPSGPRC